MSTAPNEPALPSIDGMGAYCRGLTAREHAAIALRVPDSGNDWLDAMIRTAQRNDLAKAAMQGWLGSFGEDASHPAKTGTERFIAREAFELADAMLSASAAHSAEGGG